jgi:hypothetical protein
MKKTSRCAILLAILGAAIPVAYAAHSKLRISKHSAGPIFIGMRAQAPYDQLPRDRVHLVDLMLEGDLTPALEIQPPGTSRRNAIVAELGCREGLVVSRIMINDPALVTARGISVGMTVGRLRAAYGAGRLVSGEGDVGIRIDELSATFLLANNAAADAWMGTTDASVVPASVKIRRILLN